MQSSVGNVTDFYTLFDGGGANRARVTEAHAKDFPEFGPIAQSTFEACYSAAI